MKVLESIVVAFSMYSKIPMPHIEWNKENMKNVLCFFPVSYTHLTLPTNREV